MLMLLIASLSLSWAGPPAGTPIGLPSGPRPSPWGVPQEPMALDPLRWEASVPAPLVAGHDGELRLRLVVPQGFVVYRDQLDVVVLDDGGLAARAPSLPPGMVKVGADGESREQYDMDVIVVVPVAASRPGLHRMVLQVRHQGCQGGLCYAPRTALMELYAPVSAP